MNDRFKFRVWSNKENKMYKVHSLHIGTNKAIVTALYGNASITLDDKVLMQSTGLHDKNGKLIYEGDIVKIGNNSINGEVLESVQIVQWRINKWIGCPIWIIDKPNTSHYIEVIGNKYENPERLEVNNE